MHYMRWKRTGNTSISRRKNGTGNINKGGYLDIRVDGKRIYEHVHVAEKALGKPLPNGAKVHHVNEIRSDNKNNNLVICPNEAYHRLLHVRMKALAKCGNANWRKCWLCQNYDDPKNLRVRKNGKQAEHVECARKYNNQRHQNRIAA